jgi:DNA-3-methyladenine glycosylase II
MKFNKINLVLKIVPKNEIMQQAIQHLSKIDAVFKHIVEKYGTPTIPKRPQGFEN